MADPRDHTRRGFVYRRLEAAGAVFGVVAGCAIAESFPGDAARIAGVGLVDLSPLPRAGFKGPAALATLAKAGLTVPDANNRALRQEDGALVVRLADTEALILSGLAGHMPGELDRIAAAGCYPVPRRDSHAWFAVAGPDSVACLAKLCGVDLRPRKFADGAVAQCIVAGISAILIRDDGIQAHHLLADSASAGYLWDCLIDAMAEYDGGPMGRACLARENQD
jgi:sarcosine oxidase subunit gamma